MSVLVKGMEMPMGNCEWLDKYGHLKRCKLLNGEDCCKMQEHLPEVSTWQEQYARCPLEDVPTPHGRLIDADEMKRLWMGCHIEGSIGPLLDIRPAVIEAED